MEGKPLFTGTWVALVTPFKPSDRTFDPEAYRRIIDYVIEGGVDGIVPCGTTGEKSTLTTEEHRQVIEAAIAIADGRVKVIAGTGSNDTEHAAAMAAFAKSAGADGALSVTPYYNKPTQEGLYGHYRYIMEKADMPMVIYNVPGRTSVSIQPETIARLMDDPRFVAVKDASGNLNWTMAMVQAAAGRPDFSILSGDDALTLPMIAAGAHGVISVIGNEAPGPMSELVAAARAGDFAKAREIQYRLLDLMHGNFMETSPGPVKYALSRMGLIPETLRRPLCPITEASREKMDGMLKKLGLL